MNKMRASMLLAFMSFAVTATASDTIMVYESPPLVYEMEPTHPGRCTGLPTPRPAVETCSDGVVFLTSSASLPRPGHHSCKGCDYRCEECPDE